VRYDELQRGIVEHALRVTLTKDPPGYVYPATHHASKNTDPTLPRMGERIRCAMTSTSAVSSPELQAILKGQEVMGCSSRTTGSDWI